MHDVSRRQMARYLEIAKIASISLYSAGLILAIGYAVHSVDYEFFVSYLIIGGSLFVLSLAVWASNHYRLANCDVTEQRV